MPRPSQHPRNPLPPMTDSQIASANSTLHAFIGGRQRSWMTTGAVKPTPRQAPRKQAPVPKAVPPPASAPATAPPASAPPALATAPAVLPSPAPSDEPSPAVSHPLDSPIPPPIAVPEPQETTVSSAQLASPTLPTSEARFLPHGGLNRASARRDSVASMASRDSNSLSRVHSPAQTAPRQIPRTTGGNSEGVQGRAGRANEGQRPAGPAFLSQDEYNPPAKRQRTQASAARTGALVSRLDSHVSAMGGLEQFSPELERPRFQLLRDACMRGDVFFVVLHQLYCLWSVNSRIAHSTLPSTPPALDAGFAVLEHVLKKNNLIGSSHLNFCFTFPSPVEELVHGQGLYSQVTPDVAMFLERVGRNWNLLIQTTLQRRYPCLVDELVLHLHLISPVLQKIFFTASRRRLGLLDHMFGERMDALFQEDQLCRTKPDGNFTTPPGLHQAALEARNLSLISRYRQFFEESIFNRPGGPSGQPGPQPSRRGSAAHPSASAPSSFPRSPHTTPSTIDEGPSPVMRQSLPSGPLRQPSQFLDPTDHYQSAFSPAGQPSMQTLPQQYVLQSNLAYPNQQAHARHGSATLASPILQHANPMAQAALMQYGNTYQQGAQVHPRPQQSVQQQAHSYFQNYYQQQVQQLPNAGQTRLLAHPNVAYPPNMPISPSTSQPVPSPTYAVGPPATMQQPGRVSADFSLRPGQQAMGPQVTQHGVQTQSRNQEQQRQRPFQLNPHTLRQPLGYQIPTNEYPHDANEKKAILNCLHQAHLRSPTRSVREHSKSQAGQMPERHFQAVGSLVCGPCPVPPKNTLYTFEFTVSNEDFDRVCRPQSAQKGLLPVWEHFDGSLRYRLRTSLLRKSDSVAESVWVMTDTSWPSHIFIQVNNEPVTIRRKAHNGKDLPAEIADFVRVGKNVVEIAISTANPPLKEHCHFLAIEAVETMSRTRVLEQVSNVGRLTVDESRQAIMKRINAGVDDDDEIVIAKEDLSIDIADPFSARVWTIPARGSACTHMECFDLETWLDTRPDAKPVTRCFHKAPCHCPRNAREPSHPDKWKCPLCSSDARPRSLRIDEFLLSVREKLGQDNMLHTKSISVSADGSWRPNAEPAEEDDGSDGEGPLSRPGPVSLVRRRSSTKQASVDRLNVEVIELD